MEQAREKTDAELELKQIFSQDSQPTDPHAAIYRQLPKPGWKFFERAKGNVCRYHGWPHADGKQCVQEEKVETKTDQMPF
jgi:hypothetical protein